ncbi:PPR repeat protein [Medicago truncatula]|uniref:PPR repeat protein n=1 Tax=Medicago truncatula TaxID=3880 RepID=G7I3C6_MEDTR|nr:PPR repeat protein [Medicago truncatula]
MEDTLNNRLLKQYFSLLGDCILREAINKEYIYIYIYIYIWVSLINIYVSCSNHTYVRWIFDEIPQQDIVSWTALVQGFVDRGNSREVIELLCEMKKAGIGLSGFTVASCSEVLWALM